MIEKKDVQDDQQNGAGESDPTQSPVDASPTPDAAQTPSTEPMDTQEVCHFIVVFLALFPNSFPTDLIETSKKRFEDNHSADLIQNMFFDFFLFFSLCFLFKIVKKKWKLFYQISHDSRHFYHFCCVANCASRMYTSLQGGSSDDDQKSPSKETGNEKTGWTSRISRWFSSVRLILWYLLFLSRVGGQFSRFGQCFVSVTLFSFRLSVLCFSHLFFYVFHILNFSFFFLSGWEEKEKVKQNNRAADCCSHSWIFANWIR